ncbi:TIGR03857 family LLM class F420-dependent oxidoreductase [Rhodococcus sp. X156]|uniref:TIGR03857 family LLM class F420-dependent oxidoreductase n=1 Tax=Rhodococcus sp. X156 TaxID=2499145 RepID=UPI000FD83EE4|nr:TIGR03857 family LLM class F420-dependent oxidoreductase [Rhodococcus sp. X156]
MDQLTELGFYTLAGAPRSPAEVRPEVAAAEEMGLGSAFISERFTIKEAVTLSGAVGALSRTLGVATAATNHNTRHPVVTASYATTMHGLTDGRFTLGLGRGIEPLFDAFGIPRITSAQIEDFVGLVRRLWRGETIIGHDGPAGKYPVLHLDSSFDADIPVGMVAFGPRSLALAGRTMDMVVLHTYFTDDTVRRAVQTVRTAAEQAGRDPAAVRIWSCYATVGDHLPTELRLKKTVGRLATYLQGYGDLLVRTNGWDPAVLDRFRADPVVQGVPGAIDTVADVETLGHVAGLLPAEWLEPAATGSPRRCAERVLAQLDLGVDGVILHGATPAELEPVVAEYRGLRPAGRFDGLDANPGRPRAAATSWATSAGPATR